MFMNMNTVKTTHTTMKKKNKCILLFAIIFLGSCRLMSLLIQTKLPRDHSVSKGKKHSVWTHLLLLFFPKVNHISLFSYIKF